MPEPTQNSLTDEHLRALIVSGKTGEALDSLTDEEATRLARIATRIKQGTPETSPQIERSKQRLEALQPRRTNADLIREFREDQAAAKAAQSFTGRLGRAFDPENIATAAQGLLELPGRAATLAGDANQSVANFLSGGVSDDKGEIPSPEFRRTFTPAERLLGRTEEGLPLPGMVFNAKTGEPVESPFGPTPQDDSPKIGSIVDAIGDVADFTARMITPAPTGNQQRELAGQFITNLAVDQAQSIGISFFDHERALEQSPSEFFLNLAEVAVPAGIGIRRGAKRAAEKGIQAIVKELDDAEAVIGRTFDEAFESYRAARVDPIVSTPVVGRTRDPVAAALTGERITTTPVGDLAVSQAARDAKIGTESAQRLNVSSLPRGFVEERRALQTLPLHDSGSVTGLISQLQDTLRIPRSEAKAAIRANITDADPKGLNWARDVVARRRAFDQLKNVDPGPASERLATKAFMLDSQPVINMEARAARNVESVLRAATKTADDVNEAAHQARLAGATDSASEMLKQEDSLRERIQKLHERAGKTAQEEMDELRDRSALKADSVVAASDEAVAAAVGDEASDLAKLSAQAGVTNAEMATRFAAGSLGGAIGARASEDGKINWPGAVMGGALGFAFITPQTLSLTKKAPNFEKALSDVIVPMLPERLPQALGQVGTATAFAAVGGAVGGFPENEEFSLPMGIAGTLLGGALGARFANRAIGGLDNFNPKREFVKWFTEGGGKSAAANELQRQSMTRMSGRLQKWVDVNRRIARRLEGDEELGKTAHRLSIGEASPDEIADVALREDIALARHLWDEAAVDLLETGMAQGEAAKTILGNMGTYLPRLYLELERRDVLDAAHNLIRREGTSFKRLSDLDYLKKRKDIPKEIRESLGEIVDNPGLLGLRRAQMIADIEFNRYTRQLAASAENALPPSALTDDAAGLLAGGKARLFRESGEDMAEWNGIRYRKLADNKRLGVLRNRYVEEFIADDLEVFVEMPSKLRRFLDQGTAFFKQSKVTFNPATLMQNVYGNIILADMGGLSPRRLGHYTSSFNDYLRKSGRYLEARDAGLYGGEYYGAEVRELLTAVEKSGDKSIAGALNWVTSKTSTKIQKPFEAMIRFHEGSEQAWKTAMYNWGRDRMGMSPDAAVQFAKRWIFDYREVPRWIQTMRKSPIGAPFISFSYKAAPRVLENAIALGDPKKLWRFWKYPLALGAVNEYSARKQGLLEEGEKGIFDSLKRVALDGLGLGELSGLKKYMPDYTGGNQILMPWTDVFGRFQLLDGTWWLPWGDFTEVGKGRVGEAMSQMGMPFPRQFEPSNPWLQITAAALTGGKDPFTGKEIVPIYQNLGDAQLDWARYSLRQFWPTLTPSAGFAARNLAESFSGDLGDNPNVATRPMSVLKEVLGLPIRPLSPQLGARFKERGLEARLAKGDRRIDKLIDKIPQDQETISDVRSFLAGEKPLKELPKNVRGAAKKIKEIRESQSEDERKFAEQMGGTAERFPMSDKLKSALGIKSK